MNRIAHRIVAASVLAMVVLAGASPPTTEPTATVQIENFSFMPRELTVPAGTTVTWVNKDDVPHTATAVGDTPLFDSNALDTDDTYSFTFKQPGTFPYYCKVHPHMTGKIIVQ
ncbi:MAG: cupredoxin family copper-binding protein [Tepidisphaeraceae bacterium]|jgi:plastocyanin